MDNASKALIMAGAILIAVALVSLGVYLYQSAASKVNDGTRQVDASQMIMLNSEIEKFEGTIKGSELKQLVRLINADNKNQVFPTDLTITDSTSHTNKIALDSTTKTYGLGDTRDSANYSITISYSADGWVTGVEVK